MSVRKSLPVALSLVVAAGALAPAVAAPAKPKPKPKPITATYALQLAPVPSPVLGPPGPEAANSCVDDRLEGISTNTRAIKVAGAGVLKVTVTGFAGDWDITARDGAKVLGIGSGTITGDPSSLGTSNTETLTVKTRRATTLKLGVCNYLGGPTATVKYVFTYS